MAERSIAFGLFAKDNASSVFKKVGDAAEKSAQAIDKATDRLAKATLSQADAAGKVRVAEAKLKDLRESGKATATQLTKAEEDLASAQRKAEASGKDVERATRGMESAQKSATTRTVSLGDAAGKVGGKLNKMANTAVKAFAAVTVAAGAAAVKIGVDAVKAAMVDASAARKLEITLQNVTHATKTQVKAVEEYISKTSLRLGIEDDKLRPALARLVRSTGDTTKAQHLLNLALNISAGTGKDLDTVVAALGKAYDGNMASLGRLGLGLDKNLLKVKDATAANKAHKAAVAKLQEAQAKLTAVNADATHKASAVFAAQEQVRKAQAKVAETAKDVTTSQGAMSKVMEKLRTMFKGFADADAATMEGKMRRVKVAFDEAKESLGYMLMDALTPYMQKLTDLIPKLQTWIELNGPGIKKAFEEAAPKIERVVEAVGNLITWASDHKDALTILAEGLAAAFATIKMFATYKAIVTGIMQITGALSGLAVAQGAVASTGAAISATPIAAALTAATLTAAGIGAAVWAESQDMKGGIGAGGVKRSIPGTVLGGPDVQARLQKDAAALAMGGGITTRRSATVVNNYNKVIIQGWIGDENKALRAIRKGLDDLNRRNGTQ